MPQARRKPSCPAPDAQEVAKATPKPKASDVANMVWLARREPVEWIRQVLNHRRLETDPIPTPGNPGWELDQFQVELIEAFADVWRKKAGWPTRINHEGKNFITVRSGHGPGKTHTVGLLAHLFNGAFPGRIIATAPKFDQLKTRLWSAFRRIDARASSWYRATHEVNDTAVYWQTLDDHGRVVNNRDYCMLAETANKPESLAGHHENCQLVLVEEATGVPESLYPVILGALSTGALQILVMISNPTKEQGYFADSHLKRETESQFFRYHVTLDKAQRVDRSWYRKLCEKYGEDSPVVRVRGRGEFPGSSPNQLIALEWIENARNREVNVMTGDGSLPRLRVSVDCAAGGTNETVVAVCKHFQSIMIGMHMSRHSFKLATATIETADAAEAAFKRYGGRKDEDDFVVDSLGVGVGVAGVLISRSYRVVTYQGGASSDSPTRWRCRRVQSYINLRNDFRDGSIALLDTFFEDARDWDDFDGQLCSIQNKGGDRVDDLITKEEMQRMGIISPDMADTLAMQRATQAPTTVTKAMHGTNEIPPTVRVFRSTVNDGLEGL